MGELRREQSAPFRARRTVVHRFYGFEIGAD
jgi:hypothetical protein